MNPGFPGIPLGPGGPTSPLGPCNPSRPGDAAGAGLPGTPGIPGLPAGPGGPCTGQVVKQDLFFNSYDIKRQISTLRFTVYILVKYKDLSTQTQPFVSTITACLEKIYLIKK